MATKKIIINNETKHKIKKIIKVAVPCVIGGGIVALAGIIFYKKGMKVGVESYNDILINFYKDPNNFNLFAIDNDAAKNGILLVTGNVMKSEDDIVTFLSNRYYNGNPKPEILDNIIKSAKEIVSLYHVN